MNSEKELPDVADTFLGEEPKTETDSPEAESSETTIENEEETELKVKKSLDERIKAYLEERKIRSVRDSMDSSIRSSNYMSFIRRSPKPVFITEEKKDEYRSMHRLDRTRKILGVAIAALVLIAVGLFAYDNLVPKESDDGSSQAETTAVTVSAELPRDDFEPVSYDSDTGLAVYDDDFNLFIVSESSPISESYSIDTKEYMGVELDEKIIDAVSLLVSDAEAAGHKISFERGYISYENQLEVYDAEIERLRKLGYTHLMSQHRAGENVDVPGQSDYHTGMSIKLKVDSAFGDSSLYRWLSSHAAEYGFVFRYPEGKSTYTGKAADLSVIRYVGRTNAVRMRQLSMCLEEYADYINSR